MVPFSDVCSAACTHLSSRAQKSPDRPGFSVSGAFISRSPLINEGSA